MKLLRDSDSETERSQNCDKAVKQGEQYNFFKVNSLVVRRENGKIIIGPRRNRKLHYPNYRI